MYKQIIIARRDLNMSPGKLAAQVAHGSMAFLTWLIRNQATPLSVDSFDEEYKTQRFTTYYDFKYAFDKDLYEQWINGEFTKVVLQARNKNHILKAKTMAEELGMKEGEDFFLIRDNCHTELEPEEDGRTLTVIGFKPMDAEIIDKIGRKYHLYQ